MNLLALIAALEAHVDQLLASIVAADANAARLAALRRAASKALIDQLDAIDPGDLAQLSRRELEQLVIDTLRPTLDGFRADQASLLTERTVDLVTRTRDFYDGQGLDTAGIAERARRTEDAQKIGQLLRRRGDDGADTLHRHISDTLSDAIRRGHVDTRAIAEEVETRAEQFAQHAFVETQAAVSAYNQLYRNELADEAGLTHFLYFGSTSANTRPFCRAHLDRVFSLEQIDQMDNGMLNPVRIYKGGYRCRHSWLPVDPEWDEDLRQRTTPADIGPHVVTLGKEGDRTITIIPSEAYRARLSRQKELRADGYTQFIDAPDERGFVAKHKTHIDAVADAVDQNQEKVLDALRRSERAAKPLSQLGYEVRLDRRVKNRKAKPDTPDGEADVDLIVTGGPFPKDSHVEAKQPDSFSRRAFERVLSESKGDSGVYQSFDYVINLVQEMPDETYARALGGALSWLRRRAEEEPGAPYRVFILHSYTAPHLEQVQWPPRKS
ncbi:MAG: hypothetical protein IAE99_08365 [Rhodothermales bacterium]|nr:hypothetical protein [Rhodothermales bacterium]